MSKVTITHEFDTHEEAHEHLAKLTGQALEHAQIGHCGTATEAGQPKKAGRPKASEVKETAAAQTKTANAAPKAPANKAPTLEEIKKEIAEWAGTGDAETVKKKVTEFVRSFGVAKMSDTTDAIRQQMRERIAEEGPSGDDELNPMD